MQPTSSFSPTRIRGPWLLGSLGVAASLLLAGCDSAGFDMSGAQCEGILPGDLVITELLANPEGSDDGQEWFEVHNASEQSLDLDGLVLVTSKADGSGEKSVQVRDLTLPFDGYLVFGAGDPEAPRAFVDQVYPASLGNLRNSDGRIALRCGDRIVDEVLYARSPDGASLAFDGGRAPDAIGNDDEQLWCSDEVDGQSSQPGSPGAPNPPCAGVAATPGGTQDGMCSEGGLRREARTPAMGDLRISELHADPAAVGDAEGEWFELQVLRDLDLNGLQVSRAVDEVGLDIAGEDCRGVSSGDRLLFARSQDSAVNGGLPTPDFLFEFLLTNSDGQLLLIHGGAVLDQRSWRSGDVRSGEASSRDAEGRWCPAVSPYGDGDLGSPGQANPACPADMGADPTEQPVMDAGVDPGREGMCLEGGGWRDLRAPAPGDLRIQEVHADPAAVSDTRGEWFELQVLRDLDLNGLQLGRSTEQPGEPLEFSGACQPVLEGALLLFARSADSALNGGLPAVDQVFGFPLTNGQGSLRVHHEDVEIDAHDWQEGDFSPGVARSRDGDGRWCDASQAYGDGDLGTPAAANPACGSGQTEETGSGEADAGVSVDAGGVDEPAGEADAGAGMDAAVEPSREGMCRTGDIWRDVVSPGVGALVISEVMANPSAVGDAQGEWFELQVGADVDLNGLVFENAAGVSARLEGEECLAVSADSTLLFVREGDAGLNGGLPEGTATVDLGLVNSDGMLRVKVGALVVDEIRWSAAEAGVSYALEPSALDAASNDDATAWCRGAAAYGAGDLGSPGVSNANCGPWQVGDRCLDGDEARLVEPPAEGALVFTEMMIDPEGVSDFDGEWLELLVLTDLDLNGVQIGRALDDVRLTFESASCLRASAGSRVLVAGSADPVANGGLPTPVASARLSLVNGEGQLLVYVGGSAIDAVSWSDDQVNKGRSLSLDPMYSEAQANDAPDRWCAGVGVYNPGVPENQGTPGLVNGACP